MTAAGADAALPAGRAASFGHCERVRVRVATPDIGWEVDDRRFEVSGPPGVPAITATVRGLGLDFPDVARRLRGFAGRLACHGFVD